MVARVMARRSEKREAKGHACHGGVATPGQTYDKGKKNRRLNRKKKKKGLKKPSGSTWDKDESDTNEKNIRARQTKNRTRWGTEKSGPAGLRGKKREPVPRVKPSRGGRKSRCAEENASIPDEKKKDAPSPKTKTGWCLPGGWAPHGPRQKSRSKRKTGAKEREEVTA